MVMHLVKRLVPVALFTLTAAAAQAAEEPNPYYRIVTYAVPKGMNLEASGLAVLPDGKLAVSIRRGEVWIIQNPQAEPPTVEKLGYKLFASGMHEILGLAWHEGALYVTQRSEVTRLRGGLADLLEPEESDLLARLAEQPDSV